MAEFHHNLHVTPSRQSAETQRSSPVFPAPWRLGAFALNWELLKGASLHERLLHDFQIGGGQNAQEFFKSNGRQRADGLHVGDGFLVEKRQMSERHFQFAT